MRRAGPAHHDPKRVVAGVRQFRGIGRRQHAALGGQRHRAGGKSGAAFPQSHVHGPVGPAVVAELPRPVQRVDDPYPVRGQPRLAVDALLGQHGVGRPVRSEFRRKKLV